MDNTNVSCLISKVLYLLNWSIFTGMDIHRNHCRQILIRRKLVLIEMTQSNIKQLWNITKVYIS